MKKLLTSLPPLLCILALLLIQPSCKKEDPPNPHEDYVMTCKVNGQAWEAYCEGNILFGCNPVDCQFYPDTRGFEIWGGNGNVGIRFSILNIIIGNNNIQYQYSAVLDPRLPGNCAYFNIDTTYQNNMATIIQIDTVTKKIEGGFTFRAINECNDTVLITDGYFNTKYRP